MSSPDNCSNLQCYSDGDKKHAGRQRGLQRARSGSVPGGCGEARGSEGLGLYKAIETDAHSCRAVWEMFTTQTHHGLAFILPTPSVAAGIFQAKSEKESYCSVYARAELDGVSGVIALTALSIGTL